MGQSEPFEISAASRGVSEALAAEGPFPEKVGKTSNDVSTRATEQCKSSAAFEAPVVLGSWKVKRMSYMETAIHSVLKARGRWREAAPGKEWFDTTLFEVEGIVKFVAI